MILNDVLRRRIESLARSSQAKNLFEFLEVVKLFVADVRNDISCKPEIEREVRIATCQAIDELIIATIKRMGNTQEDEKNEFV